jgi:hypothetical protein
VRNEVVLYRDKEKRNIKHTMKGTEDNLTGRICYRICLVKRVFMEN